MTEHTDLPWRIESGAIVSANGDVIGVIYRTEAWSSGDAIESEDQANAAFVDRAMNNHEALVDALTELHAKVWGECPSLLNEDSGGDARLDLEIEQVLAAVSSPSTESGNG